MRSDRLRQAAAARAAAEDRPPSVAVDDQTAVFSRQPKLSPSSLTEHAWIGVDPGRDGAMALLLAYWAKQGGTR